MTTPYFRKYLQVAPFALALWRAVEAQAIADAYKLVFINLKKRPSGNSNFSRPLLDLGCGFGEFSGVFFDHQVEVGIDVSLEDLLRAKRGKKYKRLQFADARNLPFPARTFATVLSVSVLEHIPYPENAIVESFRVLKPKGLFIFTVPTQEINQNLFYPAVFKRLGLIKLRRWYIDHFHNAFKHVNILSATKWLRITEAAGFKLLYSQGMFTRELVKTFDLALISALPSQLTRWLFGTRAIWGLPFKQPILEKIFSYLYSAQDITESNIVVIAQRP